YFQGHPEYDSISLLKEYKREVMRFYTTERSDYPPFPENFLDITSQAVFDEYQALVKSSMKEGKAMPDFPEHIVLPRIQNTWHDSGLAVIGNWMGLVYQITNTDRKRPLMDSLDPQNPLGIELA
ncbi:MAG: homoserine O-acetyltransferase/O-succinyltransferase family protein, partial [Leucothrix sp.]